MSKTIDSTYHKTPLTISRHMGHGALVGTHDITVVIDVIRAFTFAKTAFDNGAEKILLAETVEAARSLADAHPGAFLAGEIDALPIPGFDVGNSPSQIAARGHNSGLDGGTIVHRTTNGTRMAIAALAHATHVFVTGLSNVQATAARIRALHEDGATRLLLVATHPTGDEDVACGDHLLHLLSLPGGVPETVALDRTRNADAAAKFLDPEQPTFPTDDMSHVLRFDPPVFVMGVGAENSVPVVRKFSL